MYSREVSREHVWGIFLAIGRNIQIAAAAASWLCSDRLWGGDTFENIISEFPWSENAKFLRVEQRDSRTRNADRRTSRRRKGGVEREVKWNSR